MSSAQLITDCNHDIIVVGNRGRLLETGSYWREASNTNSCSTRGRRLIDKLRLFDRKRLLNHIRYANLKRKQTIYPALPCSAITDKLLLSHRLKIAQLVESVFTHR